MVSLFICSWLKLAKAQMGNFTQVIRSNNLFRNKRKKLWHSCQLMDWSLNAFNSFKWLGERVPTSNAKFYLLEHNPSESKQENSPNNDYFVRNSIWNLVDIWELFILFRRGKGLPKRQRRIYGVDDHISHIWHCKTSYFLFGSFDNFYWTNGHNSKEKNY